MLVFSSAHTCGDIAATVEALEISLKAMVREGSIPRELLES
jgi:hypothetical protein